MIGNFYLDALDMFSKQQDREKLEPLRTQALREWAQEAEAAAAARLKIRMRRRWMPMVLEAHGRHEDAHQAQRLRSPRKIRTLALPMFQGVDEISRNDQDRQDLALAGTTLWNSTLDGWDSTVADHGTQALALLINTKRRADPICLSGTDPAKEAAATLREMLAAARRAERAATTKG